MIIARPRREHPGTILGLRLRFDNRAHRRPQHHHLRPGLGALLADWTAFVIDLVLAQSLDLALTRAREQQQPDDGQSLRIDTLAFGFAQCCTKPPDFGFAQKPFARLVGRLAHAETGIGFEIDGIDGVAHNRA